MIREARKDAPGIHFEVGDMVTYQPEKKFDLVTCTGDALNHIMDPEDVSGIFRQVYGYLSDGGYFIFDVLGAREFASEEPFLLDYSETVKAEFMITEEENGRICMKTSVYENGRLQFEERITETVHQPDMLQHLLEENGFQVIRCAHSLREQQKADRATWFFVAKK